MSNKIAYIYLKTFKVNDDFEGFLFIVIRVRHMVISKKKYIFKKFLHKKRLVSTLFNKTILIYIFKSYAQVS